MNTWEDFDREAKIVDEYTKKQSPECVQLLQNAIGLFSEAFAILEKQDTTNATLVKTSLLSQNFASLKCAGDLALRGYYTQSMNLLRIVYENWVAFHYLSNCPDKAHFWLQGDKKTPSHSDMLKGLGENYQPLKVMMQECYHTLCRFAHSNAVCVLPQISHDYAPNEISVQLGSTYKDDLFMACVYQITELTGHMLSAVSQLVPNINEWQYRCSKIGKRILAFIDQENKKLKSQTT